MELNESKTNFNFSFAALEQLGDECVGLINRDAAELLTYGVNTAKRDLIAQKTQALKDMPTDEELLGDVMIKTDEKELLADEVKVRIRDVMIRVKSAFGIKSSQYEKFGTDGLSKLVDEKLVRCGNRVIRVANEFLVELQAKGLTPQELTDLQTTNNDFDRAIDAKEDAVKERDFATKNRAALGNELYALIVEVYDYGKTYWVTRDESKYNDYIIYDGIIHAVQKITADVVLTTGLTIEVSMNGMLNATMQIIFGDGSQRKMIFDGINLITVNHTYATLGTYQLSANGDLLNTTEFHCNNSQLTSFGIPDDAININTYVLQNNKFTTDVVDYILTRVNSFNTAGKLLNLGGNAVPSSIGLAAKAALEARGWVVIVAS